jgi:hypothetical protein
MRKLTVLTLAILYVLTLAAVSAFATNAPRGNSTDQPKAHMVPVENFMRDYTETGPEIGTTDKPSTPSMAMGYFMMDPGRLLETTDYDLQSNARQQRLIETGADGRVHFIYTQKAVGAALTARAAHYLSYTTGGGFTGIVSVSDDLSRTPGRFVTIDVWNNKALPVFHFTKTATITMTTSALDAGSGAGAFVVEDPPANVTNCQGIRCRGFTAAQFPGYIWPVCCTDQDGSGNIVVHIAALEGNTSAGYSAIAYFRGVGTTTGLSAGMYGTCGMFVDSTSATAYDVAADPNSDRVVIAYPKSRQGNRVNNDMAYRLSTNGGVNWGPVTYIKQYAGADKERAAEDCSVLFAADGCFHVLWIGSPADTALSDYSDQECKLYHWSSCTPTCQSLVIDANNHDDNQVSKSFEQNVCKISLSQCITTTGTPDTLLYAVYCRYLGTTADPDRSAKNYPNGEVIAQASSTWGETWGAPINLTNTKTNGCTAGNCGDDTFTSSARYTKDSLNIEYMHDLDAGHFVSNESSTADLANPMMFLNYPCVAMTPYQSLSCTPSSIDYPTLHAVRNASTVLPLVLTNAGNATINWTRAIAYTNGSGWLSLPASGSVTAGCANSASINLTAGPLATEGLYKANITFSYDSPTKTAVVPVNFYVFDSWFLPTDISIRTQSNRIVVNQTSQVANSIAGFSFTYFADITTNFITDGSLIMGTSRNDLSWKIFTNGQGNPTASNPFGWIYAYTALTVDSTSNTSWRKASASAVNRDSTIKFDVVFWAPKHADSADFYVAHFDVYKGPKNPTGTVSGLTIAYSTDWDVPTDTAGNSDNYSLVDASRQAVIQKGAYSAVKERGFGVTSGWRDDKVAFTGGFSWGNNEQVYNLRGFQVDSVWKYLGLCNSFQPNDSLEDQSEVLVVGKNLSIGPTDHLKFSIILTGKRGEDNPTGLAGLQATLDKAKAFICAHVIPNTSPLCAACSGCGDANSDGGVDISDAVFLIQYIFAGGAAPAACNYANGMGDANGDGGVDISDAVYLIQYIFAGGPAPHCQ